MTSHSLVELLADHASGTAALFLALLVATFVLEDVATVAAGLLAGRVMIDPAAALTAVLLGTILGDIFLYATGRWFSSTAFAARLRSRSMADIEEKLLRKGIYAVIAARFLPGTRLAVFFASGVIRLPLARFCFALTGSTLLWTPALFFASMHTGQSLLQQLTPAKIAIAVSLVIGVSTMLQLINHVRSKIDDGIYRRQLPV